MFRSGIKYFIERKNFKFKNNSELLCYFLYFDELSFKFIDKCDFCLDIK